MLSLAKLSLGDPKATHHAFPGYFYRKTLALRRNTTHHPSLLSKSILQTNPLPFTKSTRSSTSSLLSNLSYIQ